MRGVVIESATLVQPGQTYSVQPFRLDAESVTQPTELEVTFLLEEEQDLPLAALSTLAAVFTPRVNLIFTPHPCFVLKKGNANLSDEVYELLVHYKNIKAHS